MKQGPRGLICRGYMRLPFTTIPRSSRASVRVVTRPFAAMHAGKRAAAGVMDGRAV